MARITRSTEEKIRGYVQEFEELTNTLDNKVFCKLCYSTINTERRGYVLQHLDSKKHKDKKDANVHFGEQDYLNENDSPFFEEIAEAFTKTNIPFHKLRHPSIKRLFKRMMHPISSSEICRKTLIKIYEKKHSELISKIKGEHFIMAVDESQKKGDKFLHIHIAILKQPFKQYLI